MEKIKINKGKELGKGAEKTVYQDFTNSDRVIGIFDKEKGNELQVKARFYLTKILHILFPDNIRDIHATYSDPNVIVNSKVKNSSWKFWKKIKYDTETKKEIMSFTTKLENDFGVFVDRTYLNFMRDEQGNLVYVDSIDPWMVLRSNFKLGKLRKVVEDLDEDKKKKCLGYLQRLINLANEAGVTIVE